MEILSDFKQILLKGNNFHKFFHSKDFSLYEYNFIFKKLQNAINKANYENIVFPDIATPGNVLIDDDNDIKIIDYDGLQIGESKSFDLSSLLLFDKLYENTKYMNNGYYTNELDKKSLYYLYFYYVFNIDLRFIDYNLNKQESIDTILNYIGIEDDEIKELILKLYSNKERNLFINNTIFSLEEKYKLVNNDADTKKLVKK